MEYLDHLIDTFRADHPEMDADVLREFAQHVRRVVKDELRDELKTDSVPVKLSMQWSGASFSAQGPRYFVEDLLERWQARIARNSNGLPASFNRPQLISGRGR